MHNLDIEAMTKSLSEQIVKEIDLEVINFFKKEFLRLETKPFSLVTCDLNPQRGIVDVIRKDTLKKGAVDGRIYTVDNIEQNPALVYLMEFTGVPFNTLAFKNYDY